MASSISRQKGVNFFIGGNDIYTTGGAEVIADTSVLGPLKFVTQNPGACRLGSLFNSEPR